VRAGKAHTGANLFKRSFSDNFEFIFEFRINF